MTADELAAYAVTVRRQQRHLQAQADAESSGRGIRHLYWRTWLDRNLSAPVGRTWPARRAIPRLTPEERIQLYESLEPGSTVIGYPRSGGGHAGALVYARGGDARIAGVSGIIHRSQPPANPQ
jgi:hypothetical protein